MADVLVVLEHDGAGNGATPIAVLAVQPDADAQRLYSTWFSLNGWDYTVTADGVQWCKATRGLYGLTHTYAVVTAPMPVEEES